MTLVVSALSCGGSFLRAARGRVPRFGRSPRFRGGPRVATSAALRDAATVVACATFFAAQLLTSTPCWSLGGDKQGAAGDGPTAARPTTTVASSAEPRQAGRRLVSVGDLHGDYKTAERLLTSLGLMGPDGGWAGGDAVFIQTGDVTDRGDASGPIYRALFRLQDEAPRDGGKVILLMGNHELMNLQNDFRYATYRDTSSMGTSDRAAVFSRDGWVGQALRQRVQAMALVGPEVGLERPVVYVHAGITSDIAEAAATQVADEQGTAQATGDSITRRMNDAVSAMLDADADQLRMYGDRSPLLGDEGVFWTRRLSLGSESSGVCKELERSLSVFGASRMVVGHTPQQDGRIHHRCGGRLVLADTFISEAYTGQPHPSALEIERDGTAVAVYPATGEREVLPRVP